MLPPAQNVGCLAHECSTGFNSQWEKEEWKLRKLNPSLKLSVEPSINPGNPRQPDRPDLAETSMLLESGL